jgi:hypothetical protein
MLGRVLFLVAAVLFGGASLAAAQIVEPEHEHFKCYTIRHLQPTEPHVRAVDLQNQFRRERCTIELPAARFCVETIKRLSPDDIATMSSEGQPATFCAMTSANVTNYSPWPQNSLAIDQFGQWPIQVRAARQVCTLVNNIHPLPVQGQ